MPKDLILDLDNIETTVDDTPAIEQIYDYIVAFIKDAEKIKGYKGDAKKYFVNSKLQSILPIETWNRYEPMIDKAIDFLVMLSSHPEILDEVNKAVKKCCIPCIQTMSDKVCCKK